MTAPVPDYYVPMRLRPAAPPADPIGFTAELGETRRPRILVVRDWLACVNLAVSLVLLVLLTVDTWRGR